MRIVLPDGAAAVIDTLERSGYEAYVVGGCVRDALLDKAPKDWDICTSALPEQTIKAFEGHHIIETGLQHGTVTVLIHQQPYEVTTYRVEGTYSDNRHPDTLTFVGSLKDDLSRRDLTINALAYNPATGLVDHFGGLLDIENKIIRCVGDANKRFQEDALRVMRALRFASALDFKIEELTSFALLGAKDLLNTIAMERIADELNGLLIGVNVEKVLLDYTEVIEVIIPEISAMVGFEQNTRYHHLDVWQHTVMSISEAPPDTIIRLTLLLHDCGKPSCYSEVDSVGHFYGHQKVSSDMARQILRRLKYSSETIETIAQIIMCHDTVILPQDKIIKRWLNRMGEQRLRQLIAVKKADTKAHAKAHRAERLHMLESVLSILDEVLVQQQCFSLKDLAIDGRDLLSLGVPEGEQIGLLLSQLLEMVIEEEVENENEQLLKVARELM